MTAQSAGLTQGLDRFCGSPRGNNDLFTGMWRAELEAYNSLPSSVKDACSFSPLLHPRGAKATLP